MASRKTQNTHINCAGIVLLKLNLKQNKLKMHLIELKKTKDYCGTYGAHFEVHFQKARSLYGDQVQPFEAKLETLDGKGTWTTKLIRARTLEQVMELKDAKMNPKEIAEELGISVRMVYKHLNNGVQTALN